MFQMFICHVLEQFLGLLAGLDSFLKVDCFPSYHWIIIVFFFNISAGSFPLFFFCMLFFHFISGLFTFLMMVSEAQKFYVSVLYKF